MLSKYPRFATICLITLLLQSYCSTAQLQQKAIISPSIIRGGIGESGSDSLVEQLMKQYPDYFDSVLKYRKEYNVQVIYTQIDYGANGLAGFTNHYFNVDSNRYFYPASAIGLPLSLLALQKLGELKENGIDRDTRMITETGYSGQTAVYNDPTTADGIPTIASYIKKSLLLNDNDACNRLYEFLGQGYTNDQLHTKQYTNAQILHRLQVPLTDDENRQTNPIKFLDAGNKLLYQQPKMFNQAKYDSRNDSVGKGFYRAGKLINEPMDFSRKNRINLVDLQTMLISLFFPYKVAAAKRFTITEDDKNFVLKYMSQYLAETTYPVLDTSIYHDAHSKYLLLGSYKDSLLNNVRIFNKSANGYGHLLDVAYIIDYEKKINFFLSAVIYCNKEGVFNEENYDTVGYPFMQQLGEVIYEYEVERKRKFPPDLSSLIFKYDK